MNMNKRQSLPKQSMMKAVCLFYDNAPMRQIADSDMQVVPLSTTSQRHFSTAADSPSNANSIPVIPQDDFNLNESPLLPEQTSSVSKSQRRLNHLFSMNRSTQAALSSTQSMSSNHSVSDQLQQQQQQQHQQVVKQNLTTKMSQSVNIHHSESAEKNNFKSISQFDSSTSNQLYQLPTPNSLRIPYLSTTSRQNSLNQYQQSNQQIFDENNISSNNNNNNINNLNNKNGSKVILENKGSVSTTTLNGTSYQPPVQKWDSMKRLGMGEWKVSKEKIGEKEWNAKIDELKASIKKKMPAFSSKLLRNYNEYQIEPNLHLAHRNSLVHSISLQSPSKPSGPMTSSSSSSLHMVSSKQNVSNQTYSVMETRTQREEINAKKQKHLALISKKISEYEKKAANETIIPKDLLETSKRFAQSGFFRISNIKPEKPTHRFLIPTNLSAFSPVFDHSDSAESIKMTNQHIKQRSNTYKTFKNAARNFYAANPSEI